jgi:hypothetical protein
MPRNDTSCPKTWSNGLCSRLKSIVVSLGALRARATADQTKSQIPIPKPQTSSNNPSFKTLREDLFGT